VKLKKLRVSNYKSDENEIERSLFDYVNPSNLAILDFRSCIFSKFEGRLLIKFLNKVKNNNFLNLLYNFNLILV
jgi:hypothetical protein